MCLPVFGSAPDCCSVRLKFDYSIHYMRAFAIVNIVLGHLETCGFFLDGCGVAARCGNVFYAVFHSDSIYFFFISGYLFHYVSSNRFAIFDYYKTKLKNIILPFIIVSFVLFCANEVLYLSGLAHLDGVNLYESNEYTLSEIALFLLQGKISGAFWYIPFIAVIFFVSPVFLMMEKDSKEKFGIFILFSMLLPLYYARTNDSFSGYMYFLPVYLSGIGYAMNRDRIDILLGRYWCFGGLAAVFCGSTFLLVTGMHDTANVFVKEHSDALFYMQKMSVIGLVLPLFNMLSAYRIRLLDSIAKLSFSMYFLHVPILCQIKPFTNIIGSWISGSPLFASLLSGLVAVAAVYLICLLLKKALGKYSRIITGS